jgi:hypothetical protein
MKKPTDKIEHSILDFLDQTIDRFPTDAEREKMIKSLDVIIAYFRDLREHVESLPLGQKQKEVLSAINVIRDFLQSAEENPSLAAALGLHFEKPMASRKPRRQISQAEGEKLFNELKQLTTEQIQRRLLDFKGTSMGELRGLATYLGIKEADKISRQTLVDKIVKIGFANVRGYEILRSRE